MQIDLKGRTALVTGGAIGIGRAISLELARAGAAVGINYFGNSGDAEETLAQVQALGAKAMIFQADVTELAQVKRLVAAVNEELGDISILVNNVGGLVGRVKVEEMTEEFYQKVMDVNVKSAFFVSQAVIPAIRRTGWGRVINLSSLAAHNGGGNGSTAYAAAKAAVLGITRGLAKEISALGATVNAVAPGLIGGTPFHATFTAPEAFQAMKSGILVGREGNPADIARAVCFLASEQASFINGECLELNGGAWMR